MSDKKQVSIVTNDVNLPESLRIALRQLDLQSRIYSPQEATSKTPALAISDAVVLAVEKFANLQDQDMRQRRLAQVEEIVQHEKPAHTDFDIKFYWSLFQIGGARLGLDTVLGEGSRFVALVLGVNYLGQSYLEGGHPWDVTDRTVLGRDPLRRITNE